MANRFLEIPVSNKTSDGKMSFHHGIANLIFQIPSLNSTLIPSSVRICGKIRCYNDDANAEPSAELTCDPRLGVYGTFMSLTTRSIKHQQTIENIRHYAHFLSNFLPLSTSSADALNNWSTTAGITPSYNLNRNNADGNDSGGGIMRNNAREFCLPLPCGLLNGTSDIPLSDNMLGGLELVIALASDSQFLYAIDGASAGVNTAWYEFDDLKLVCEVRDYTPDELSKLMRKSASGFTYQSISSYYDVINSQNANIVFNLGLSKVRSIFSSFIPSNFLNNYAQNSYATLMPSNTDGQEASIRKITWTKGGSLYPKMMELNTNIRDSPTTLLQDPVVIKDYVDSVSDFGDSERLQMNLNTTNRDVIFKNSTTASENRQIQYTKVANSGVVFGCGIRYDALGGQGVDFSNPGSQFGMNLELDLTTNSPQSVFIFVNSEINVVFNQNGIQVLQ
jgi:hypothetical protein